MAGVTALPSICIGVFDSGVGGITVLSEAMRCLPYASFIYYADTKHVPYGEKNAGEVMCYVKEAVAFLQNKKIDALVLACNTATSVSAAALREELDIPIIGMEPAVKPALIKHGMGGRIVVTATDMTLRMEKLKDLIHTLHADDRVDKLSLQKLVRFAETGIFDAPEVERYVREQFAHVNISNVQAVVLGCTHFTYFKPMLRRIFPPHVALIDGNVGTVSRLCSFFPTNHQENSSRLDTERVRFYESGQTASPDRSAFFFSLLSLADQLHDR